MHEKNKKILALSFTYFQMSGIKRKPDFCFAKTKVRINCAVITQLGSAFAFTIQIVQSLFFLSLKFQSSSYLLSLYIQACVNIVRNYEGRLCCESSYKLLVSMMQLPMSRDVRKPDFCICENKAADQLCGNRTTDQRLCFRYMDSTIPLLP